MPKKIAVVMNEDHRIFYSGVTRFVMEIAPRLAKRYEVTLVSTRSENGLRRERLGTVSPASNLSVVQFPMYQLPFPNTYIPRFNFELSSLLNKSDLVFIQTLDLLEALIRARRLKKPILYYLHALDWEMLPRTWGLKKAKPFAASLIRKFWAWSSSRVSHICLPSPSYVRYLNESKVKTPSSWVPAGIDIDRFRPPEEKQKAKKQIGFGPKDFVIGFVGRLWPDKNIDLLLDLFSRVNRIYPQAKFLLVGKGFEKLEKRAASLPGVVWVGYQHDVVRFYQAMDLFCHLVGPNETSSFVTMEAMACGLPVIVNAEALPRDYVENGVDGLLVDPPNNPLQVEKHICRLLKDSELRNQMGLAGRQKMEKSFRWEHTANLLEDLIEHYTEVH